MPPNFRNSKTVIRQSSEEGYFAGLSQIRKASAPTKREERRSKIAYEIETAMRDKLGPMQRIKDAA